MRAEFKPKCAQCDRMRVICRFRIIGNGTALGQQDVMSISFFLFLFSGRGQYRRISLLCYQASKPSLLSLLIVYTFLHGDTIRGSGLMRQEKEAVVETLSKYRRSTSKRSS